MKKPPFKMLPSRYAAARRPGGRPLSGRASYVWLYGVLVPAALGAKGIEIRRKQPDGPWHEITLTESEAYEQLKAHYPLNKGLHRTVDLHREKRGLE